MEVHRLLTEKKPFDEHLKLMQRRSDDLRRRDIEFGRAHKESLLEMRTRCDDEMKESRRALRDGIRDFNKKIADREAVRSERVQGQNDTFKDQRAAMETRVRSMPMLGGEPPARESKERTLLRENGFEAIKDSTNAYFQDMRQVKDKLGTRPKTLSFGKKRRPQDDILEEKKANGLASLGKTTGEYGSYVEKLYEKHRQRNLKDRQKHKEDFQAHVDHKLAAQDAHIARTALGSQKIKEELVAREERLRSRPKSFGGYKPQAKSERRLQIEAAHAELEAGL